MHPSLSSPDTDTDIKESRSWNSAASPCKQMGMHRRSKSRIFLKALNFGWLMFWELQKSANFSVPNISSNSHFVDSEVCKDLNQSQARNIFVSPSKRSCLSPLGSTYGIGITIGSGVSNGEAFIFLIKRVVLTTLECQHNAYSL